MLVTRLRTPSPCDWPPQPAAMESRPPSARPVSPAPYLHFAAVHMLPGWSCEWCTTCFPLESASSASGAFNTQPNFVLLPPGKHKFAPRSRVPQEPPVRPPALSSFPALPAVLAVGGTVRQGASRTPRALNKPVHLVLPMACIQYRATTCRKVENGQTQQVR